MSDKIINSSENALWDQWMLFPQGPKGFNKILFEKQIGMVADNQNFSHRSKWQDPPGVINIFEAVLNGIEYRFKKGLYKNKHKYFIDHQIALQECLKTYKDHHEIIIDAFQNKTLLTVSKEKEPKVVTVCEKCKHYSLVNVHCPKCKSAFYCDQACLKAHNVEYQPICNSLIESIPAVLEPLQVEIHSYSWNKNINLYFEHET